MHRERFVKTTNTSSESWADRKDVVDGWEAEAVGSLTLKIPSPPIADFEV